MQSTRIAKIFGDKEDPRRRLATLFEGTPSSATPQLASRQWATAVLDDAGIDPHTVKSRSGTKLEAIAALRKAEPRLTLKTARYLVDHLVQ